MTTPQHKAQPQDERILEWLLTGLPITQFDANYRLKPAVSRLSAIILKIEKYGFKGWIDHKRLTVKNSDGESVSVTQYSL